LEKLLGAGSFGNSISHLAHHQTILFIFSSEFSLPSIIWIVALAFLGCWALIAIAFITRFQHDDHPILLDAITHFETDIFPFQMVL
jgi:hypothetical protein